MRRVATALALAVLAISAAGALLDAGLENAHRALAPATTAAVIRPQRAEYRALAERRARGAVRGPRVTEAGLEITLAYRRGRRWRVLVSVTRALAGNALSSPRVASTGCRRR